MVSPRCQRHRCGFEQYRKSERGIHFELPKAKRQDIQPPVRRSKITDRAKLNYKTEFDRFEQGIDAVLNRARTLVDSNLMLLDEKIRTQLYDSLGLKEDNLIRIESVEFNGQQSYNLTYSKKNPLYLEFYIVQTDKDGNIKEVLESR